MKVKEINEIAKKLNLTIEGIKQDKIQTLMNYFQTPGYWKTIIK
jgi:hypothetical protein